MTQIDKLCSHPNPVIANRARRLLAGEAENSPTMRKLREEIGSSEMAQRLLLALHGERFNPYRKWQGPHWTLYSLAEINYPTGDERLLPLRQRAMDWMFAPAFLSLPAPNSSLANQNVHVIAPPGKATPSGRNLSWGL